MKTLDLFCGAGGAAMGLHRAGFEVIGVDINPQPEYPFKFIQSDVFNLDLDFSQFDFIWTSPPCQNYSWATVKWRNQGKKYLDLIGKTRKLLLGIGKPSVIENVVGAPIRKDLLLCGEMFGLRVIRHRIFEIEGFSCIQPKHRKHKGSVWHGELVGVWTGGKPGCFGNEEHRKYYATVAGHGGGGGKGNCTLKAWQEAMGINWITNKKMLAEAVPPAYSEYIGRQFMMTTENGKFIPETSYIILTWKDYQNLKKKFGGD